MYLTRLRFDPLGAVARRDLGNPYDMHRTLVRAFVADPDQVPPRFLWRLESRAMRAAPTVLVQSAEPSDWSFLEGVDGYLAAPPATKHVALERLLVPECRCRFRLCANPVVTRDGKRRGLVGEDAQLAWLERQGQQHGFRVDAAMVTASGTLSGLRRGGRLQLRTATFEGLLRGADITALKQALLDGIGHGKAFGCGLLSIAPA